MQKTEPSLQTLTNRLNQLPWPEWVEYASLVGSAVGTLMAAASGQVVFAAAPLTVAVSLNFLNRSRIPIKTDLPQKSSQVRAKSPSIDDIFPFLPPAELFDTAGIEQEIAELRHSLTSLQESTARAIAEVRQHLAAPVSPQTPDRLNSIQGALGELRQIIERLEKTAVSEQDWETVNVQIFLIKEAIASLPDRSGDSSDLSKLEAAIAQIQGELQTQQAQLQGRVEQLEQKNREVVRPYLKRLFADVKQLQQRAPAASRLD